MESNMRSARLIVATGLLAIGILSGCQDASVAGPESQGEAGDVLLCGKCGQVKGADLCCKPGQEKCAKCGLAKGAPGCCRLSPGTQGDVELCAKCGQVKGTDACCKPGQETCGKCGLAKGSPGCCRIK